MIQISPRTRLRRHAERAVPDEACMILAQGQVAHVGLVADGQPFVIPLTYQYDPADPARLYLHGARASRVMQQVGDGRPVCVTVTLLDGLVYSRDAPDHSVNYRSVLVFGRGRVVTDAAEKEALFERMIARYHPGRTAGRDYAPPAAQDLATTTVVAVEIEEMSAKARRGGPNGPRDADSEAPGTCGVVDLIRERP